MSKVDTRQPKWKIETLRRAGWEVIALQFGDYEICDALHKVVGIEEKTTEKLVADMHTGTLTRQCRKLCENVDFPILLVEGHWAQKNGSLLGSGITWEMAWNQLQTIQDMGCRLQLTTGGQHTIDRLFELEEYYAKESHPSALRQLSGDPYIMVLSLVEGIGEEKAKRLETIYPLLSEVAACTIEDLQIYGIGEALAKRIWSFFRTNWRGRE